jgi:hypothetical protein
MAAERVAKLGAARINFREFRFVTHLRTDNAGIGWAVFVNVNALREFFTNVASSYLKYVRKTALGSNLPVIPRD